MSEILDFPVLLVLIGRYFWEAIHAYGETPAGLTLLDQIETLAGKDLNQDGSIGGAPSQSQASSAPVVDQSGNIVSQTSSGGTYVKKGSPS